MGPRVFLPGPNASGLEAQVLGPNSHETIQQAGRETIPVARAADVQRPLWSPPEFHCRDGLHRYHHLVVEDLQIRRVTAFSVKEIENGQRNMGVCCSGGVSKTFLRSYPDTLVHPLLIVLSLSSE